MSKTIIIDIHSAPEQRGYCDRGTVIADDDQSVLWHDDMSSCPNPASKQDISWDKAFAWCCIPGTYNYQCFHNASRGKHLRLSNDVNVGCPERIPTINHNINHQCARYATGILVHCGDSIDNRGSKGCHTVSPDEWHKFIGLFEVGDKGLYIIRKDK